MFISFLVPTRDAEMDVVIPIQNGEVHHMIPIIPIEGHVWDNPNQVMVGIFKIDRNGKTNFKSLCKGRIVPEGGYTHGITAFDFFYSMQHLSELNEEYRGELVDFLSQFIQNVHKGYITNDNRLSVAWSGLPSEDTTPIILGKVPSIPMQ